MALRKNSARETTDNEEAIPATASVLVLKPSSLGDIVHTLPAVARLKAARPGWHISWLVNTEWAPLLEGNPDIDEVIQFPRRQFRGLSGIGNLGGWLQGEIKGRRPDLAIDFQGLLRTALIGRISGARILLGSADAREGASWFYHQKARALEGTPHAVERYLALTNFALSSGGQADAATTAAWRAPLQYPLPSGTVPGGGKDLPDGFVLIHPFSRGEGKSLSAEQVNVLCAGLKPRRVVLAGRAEAENLNLPDNAVNLLNRTTISELIWLIRHAGFAISVDSGPMHLAAALDKPLVSIHTWSDPRRVGPYRADAHIWKNGKLLRVEDFNAVGPGFFDGPATPITCADIEAICALAFAEDGN